MAKVRFNEKGQMINTETGKVIGTTNNGKISFDSQGSKALTLEEIGVKVPQPPENMQEHRKNLGKNKNKSEHKQTEPETQSEMIEVKSENNQTSPKQGIDYKKLRKFKSKYEVSEDSTFIIKFGLLYKDQGYFIPIKDEAVNDFPFAQHHWVKFRMWNYDEELDWKNRSNEYNNAVKSLFLNYNKLNEFKIRHLILDWSFGEYDSSLKLLHCDGKLSDESYSLFKGLYPTIANTIVDLMNAVLENNA